MADKEIKIKIDAELQGGGAKSLGELKNSLEQANESSKSLKAQLKEMTLELQGLEPGSARFQELSIRAGELKDKISDTNDVIKATAGSGIENLSGALTKTAGIGVSAFQAIGGSMALFGTDAKEVQLMMGRLQGAMAVGQALKDFGALGDTFNQIKTAVVAAAVKFGLLTTAKTVDTAATAAAATAATGLAVAEGAQATATATATGAQYALNTAMLLNPVFLIITGILALGAALVIFASNNEEAGQTTEELTEELKGLQDQHDFMNEHMSLATRQYIADAKLQGASATELLQIELDAANDKIKSDFDMYNNEIRLAEKVMKKEKSDTEEYKTAKEKKRKAMEALMLQEQLAATLSAEFSLKQKEINDTEAADAEAKAAAAEAKRVARQEKFLADKKSATDKIKAIELEYSDSSLSAEEKELIVNKRKYEELIALAVKFKLDSTKLVENQLAIETEIKAKYDRLELNNTNKTQADIDLLKAENDAEKDAAKIKKIETDRDILLQNEELTALEIEKIKLDADDKVKIITDEATKREIENDKKLTDSKLNSQNLLTATELSAAEFDAQRTQEKFSQEKLEIDNIKTLKLETIESQRALELNAKDLTEGQIAAIEEKYRQAKAVAEEEAEKKLKELRLKSANDAMDTAAKGLNAIQGLGDLFFNRKKKQAKDDAVATEALAKKQFSFNKKLQLGMAMIDAGKAITASLAAAPLAIGVVPNPIGIANLAFTAITSAANIAKIASSQYESPTPPDDPGSPNSGGGGGEGGGGGSFSPTQFFGLGQGGNGGSGNGGGLSKVFVVETDITSTQNKVKVIESRALID